MRNIDYFQMNIRLFLQIYLIFYLIFSAKLNKSDKNRLIIYFIIIFHY